MFSRSVQNLVTFCRYCLGQIERPPAESRVTSTIKELFRPYFATQDTESYAVLLKTWQKFAGDHIR